MLFAMYPTKRSLIRDGSKGAFNTVIGPAIKSLEAARRHPLRQIQSAAPEARVINYGGMGSRSMVVSLSVNPRQVRHDSEARNIPCINPDT